MDDDEFIGSSRFSVLAPDATELEVKELFDGHNPDLRRPDADLVRSIKQRALLYFDELLPIYLVLKTSQSDIDLLKSFFPRLFISLELRAIGSALRNSGDKNAAKGLPPVKQEDVIWKGTLVTAEDPVLIRLGDQGDSQDGLIFVWQIKLVINRPRIRLQSPMINFKPTAALQPEKHLINEILSDPYVTSNSPASQNVLEPLRPLVAASAQAPNLSAARLRSIQPTSENPLLRNRPLKVNVPAAFRALPAISSRIRYQRSTQPSKDLSVIAHLDLEAAPFSTSDVEITKVNVELPSGSAEGLGELQIPTLPLRCSPRDKVVFLHRLTLNKPQDGFDTVMYRPLDITVDAIVQVSRTCKPVIQMRWKTVVDFSACLNAHSSDQTHAMQQANRQIKDQPNMPHSSQRGGQGEMRRQGVSIDSLGVMMTFTAPSIVHMGEIFTWNVLVFNKSSDVQRLAIVPVPKPDLGHHRGHHANISSASIEGKKDVDLARAVIDENVLYAMQKSSLSPPSDLVSLTSRVEIGPLNPGSCYESQLKLMALSTGHLRMHGVKVIDVASKNTVEVTDLPDVVVE